MASIYGVAASGVKHVATAAALAREVLARHAPVVDAERRFPKESVEELGKAGLLGLCAPGQLGGAGEGPRTFAAVVEELAGGCASTAMVYVMHVSAAQAIGASATLDGRDGVLREIAAGKHLTTLALSEAGSRSQFWAPVSELAARDGGYVTSASKSWVTSARHADSFVSSARRPGAASPADSVLYLLRTRAATVRVSGDFDGLGLRGNDSSPVEIDGHHLAERDLMTSLGEGAKMMLEVILPWFCIGSAAMANGLGRASVEATVRHMQGAAFEHTGAKLRDLPTLRARLAEMSVRTEQARALLGYTLGEVERPSPSTPLYVLQTRLASLEAAVEVTDLAMKAGGGAAFSKHLPLERLFRDARAGWVMAPTADHLKDFIGRAMTGMPLL
jgi:alkylation response protein AidB-like acyl-CoA dehydrogenase